ncbi:MAG: DeoR/GlpR family DNA-binding transcription regulator [Anaerolineaceae bacterium]|nr:DeoR/GlpR family DNA-binding transcription regulator [Anaerolineaceae bacterium]
MLKEQRLNRIITLANREQGVTIHELVADLGVVEMTIRRDLALLEKEGRIRRVRGGAISIEQQIVHNKLAELDLAFRRKKAVKQKAIIARYAAQHLVHDDEIITLEAGTTAANMIPYLSQKNLTILTNGLKTLLEATTHLPGLTLMNCGGIFQEGLFTFVGPQAEAFFDGLKSDKLFVSGTGIDIENGFTDPNILETQVKQAMAHSARQVIVLMDSSKFGRRSLTPILPLKDIDVLITDSGAPAKIVQALQNQGIDVRVVKE